MLVQPSTTHLAQGALANEAYRRVIATTPQMQLVLMTLKARGTIPGPFLKNGVPYEKHPETSQFIRVEAGRARLVIYKHRGRHAQSILCAGQSVLIPAGVLHFVANASSSQRLHLSTIYSPPEHAPNLVQFSQPP